MIYSAQIRVRYTETDQMGFSHHSSYLPWLELARIEYLRESGYSYKELEKRGVLMPVVDIHCSYRAPAFFDDVLKIDTWISELKKMKVKFEYKIFNQDGKLLTEADSLLICVGSDGKPYSMPSDIYEVLSSQVTTCH